MKAPYSAPLFVVESFAMTQSIAKNCTADIPVRYITSSDPYSCAWDLGGGYFAFVSGNNDCTIDGDLLGFACYNNPTASKTAFHS